MDQHNVSGTNIGKNLGEVNITYNGTKEDDWLQPYDSFEYDEKKYYIDKHRVEKIENTLCNKKVCLIKASEGRGKTFLSRIIAHDYFEKGYEVWFGNITKLNASGESLKQWCKKKNTNCLIILENLHACKDNEHLELFIDAINTMKTPRWYYNGNSEFLFLLNARPTSEDFDTIMSDLGNEVTEELEPDIEYCKGVASLSNRPIDEKVLDNFLKNNRFGFDKGNANLRLLGIILDIWEKWDKEEDGDLSSIEDVDENKIIHKFKTKYDLDRVIEMKKGHLMFLSSIFQFDIPLPVELLLPDEIDALTWFCNQDDPRRKGLVITKDKKFYLPHSVDASYLSKAIGGRLYIKQTQVKILDFVNRILKYETPRDFEGDFVLLVSGLYSRQEDFKELIKELTEWNKAEKIMERINPGFVLSVLNTWNGNYNTYEEVLEIYDHNKQRVKSFIERSNPVILNHLNTGFTNHNQRNILGDMFQSVEEFKSYLSKCKKIYFNGKFRSNVAKLGVGYKIVFDNWWDLNFSYSDFGPDFKFIQIGGVGKTRIRISNKWVNGIFYHCIQKNHEEAKKWLDRIQTNGFFFDKLSWKQLGKLIHWIFIFKMETKTNDNLCKEVVDELISEVLMENRRCKCLENASTNELGWFYHNIFIIDDNLHDSLMKNAEVIADARLRLNWFGYSPSELYLFSHFYSQKWCKTEIDTFINCANEEQQEIIKEWHDKVLEGLTEMDNTMDNTESLLHSIHDYLVQHKLIFLQS